jgi:hypothetical protein
MSQYIFTSKLFGYIKTFKTKMFSFVCTVYRVLGVVVGGNFSPIGEYSNTVKNRQNERWSTVALA